jgi:hypothetical protein
VVAAAGLRFDKTDHSQAKGNGFEQEETEETEKSCWERWVSCARL